MAEPLTAVARQAETATAGAEPMPPAAADTRSRFAAVLATFTATTFLSATLLFSVQPMFAKMVLPKLGGSPSVWAVALLFFQGALLVGYCYAHLLIRWLGPKRSGLVHLALVIAAAIVLPIGLPAGLGDPPAGEPYLWQLQLFAVAVGLPFVAVAANAPLLQAWFVATGHPDGKDPYFLYAASNVGSLLALLAYPLLLEPAFGVSLMSLIWTGVFALLWLALAACFYFVRTARPIAAAGAVPSSARATATAPAATVAASEVPGGDESDITDIPLTVFEAPPPPRARALVSAAPTAPAAVTLADRLGWIGLAFVPAALLTAFTTHISTDVASAPLIWVVPLALYLLTFVIVFRDRPWLFLPCALLVGAGAFGLGRKYLVKLNAYLGGSDGAPTLPKEAVWVAVGVAVVLLAAVYWKRLVEPVKILLALHVGAVAYALLQMSQTKNETWFASSAAGVAVFFTACLVAHRTLYDRRPAASHLTEFYLWMSFGGVLGGLFAALVAPKIFSEVFEYPLLVAASIACRPGAMQFLRDRSERAWVLTLAAFGLLMLYWLPWAATRLGLTFHGWGTTGGLVWLAVFGMIVFWWRAGRQLAFALAAFLALVTLPSNVHRGAAERSYFGVYRVALSDDGEFNVLTHGTTLHGAQRVRDKNGNPVIDVTPGTYYHPKSPMAQAVTLRREALAAQGRKGRYGIIGLGSGSLSCLSEEGEAWRFFEIDPVVVGISRDGGHFTYLANCQPKADIVLGDARLTMAREPDKSLDLIIVDAFTSDAIPVHLMTAEALQVYADKLTDEGIAVLHVSNRYLDLEEVLAATVPKIAGLKGIVISDDTSDGSYASTTSTIVVVSKSETALEPFRGVDGSSELPAAKLKAWTDDYSDILGPFMSKWRKRTGS